MTELDALVCRLSTPDVTVAQVAQQAGCDKSHVYRCIRRYGLELKQRKKPAKRSDLRDRIVSLSDGILTSAQIAGTLGCSEKHVQNVLREEGAKRLPPGARFGDLNHGYLGRSVDLDGYALVQSPPDHPNQRLSGQIYEHRLVAESVVGRYLLPEEVVDHIDGLHLHNSPSNLRVFASNADHLRETISGSRPNWSKEGFAKMQIPSAQRPSFPRIDSYRQRRECGDVRLIQILRALLILGKDSPHLSGTLHHLDKAQIDHSSRSKIERALDDLCAKWA